MNSKKEMNVSKLNEYGQKNGGVPTYSVSVDGSTIVATCYFCTRKTTGICIYIVLTATRIKKHILLVQIRNLSQFSVELFIIKWKLFNIAPSPIIV